MQAVVVFLVGLAISLTGAFIRSCEAVPAELFQAWCGEPPLSALSLHQHCAGCVLTVSGIGLAAVSPLFISSIRGLAIRTDSKR